MNDIWNSSRNVLISTIEYLGFPAELGELIARQLGSPKAIDRMTAYLNYARPTDAAVVVDEMLAIRAEIDAWKEKKESQEAQAEYSRWLNSAGRLRNADE